MELVATRAPVAVARQLPGMADERVVYAVDLCRQMEKEAAELRGERAAR